jgi:integrase
MPTFAQFAQRWLAEHVALKRKVGTLQEYQRIVAKHLIPELGTLPVDRIGRGDVIRIHIQLAGHRYAANRVIAVLSAMMSYAEGLGLRPRVTNPCQGVERFQEVKRKRPLTISEIGRLWTLLADIEASEGPYAVSAIRLLLLTGMRKSEVLTLQWADIDWAASSVQLRDTKTGPRIVLLSELALQILQSIPRQVGNPHVLVGEREGCHLVNLQKPWDRIRRKLGFPEVRIHDLRHTVASMLAREVPLVVVRDVLGHQVIETTSGYSHAAQADVRAALNSFSNVIGNLDR